MNIHHHRRLLLGLLLPLALTGAIAGCGDSDTTSNTGHMNNGADHMDNGAGGAGHMDGTSGMGYNDATTPTKTTAATAADVDAAFVRQMIPHHQMAVMMAELAQNEATHAELKKLADSIIASQSAEIGTMRGIAKQLGVTADHPMGGGSTGGNRMGDDAATLGIPVSDMGMSMEMMDLRGADPFDQEFIDQMIPHHEGAIRMAKAELAKGENPELKKLATAIIAAQTKEIAEMKAWKAAW